MPRASSTRAAGATTTAKASAPDVFEHLDHRAYLRALYDTQRQQSRGFSHRAFCKRAGLRSTNYLNLVMKGERNLSASMAARFAKACGLSGNAADYFCELSAWNQASSAEERERCYAKLRKFKKFRTVHQLESAQADYHATWYIPAVRELCARVDFRAEPAWIARTLQPRISVAEARAALDTLLRLGMVQRADDGTIRQVDALVTTGKTPSRQQVLSFHRAMMQRAIEALDLVPREEREVSSVTLCVSDKMMTRLMGRIREFRRELLQIAELEGPPERVLQINFQLFPLSNSAADKAQQGDADED